MKTILTLMMAVLLLPIFASVIPLSLVEQVQEADYILKGRIESMETVFTGKAKFVNTRYKLVVEKDLLGNYSQREFFFELAGGNDGEKKFRVSDIPMLDIGEVSIFLLYAPEKKYFSSIVGGNQGRYVQKDSPEDGITAVFDASGKPIKNEAGNAISFSDFEVTLERNIPIFRKSPRTFFPPDPNGNPNNLRKEDMKRWDGSDKRGKVSFATDPEEYNNIDLGPELQSRTYSDAIAHLIPNNESSDDRYVYSEYGYTWDDPPTVFNQLSSTYPILGLRDQAMMAHWNKYIKLYKVRSAPTGTYGYPDFENDICGFVDNASFYDVFERNWNPTELAVCFYWGIIDMWETDIACNPAFSWTTNPYMVFYGSASGVDNTFLHELGHAWGAGHPFTELSVMNYYQREYRAYSVLYYNDVDAVRYKYDNDIAIHNLGIYGHYSIGAEQRFEAADSDVLVTPGSSFQIRNVTVENPGTYDMSMSVDVFLTRQPCTWIGATYLTTLNLGNLFAESSNLIGNMQINVPLTVSPGYYHVALRIVTGGDQIGYDNATWINNRIRVTDPPVPGLWVGGYSPNWHFAANWSGNFIPDSTTDVRIPAGCLNNPTIVQSEGYCRNIIIEEGAALSINYNSTFFGNLVIGGAVLFGNPLFAPDVTIMGGVEIQDYGSLNFDSAGGILRVAGFWTEHPDANMNMLPNGTLQFFGNDPSTIVIQSTNSHFFNMEIMKNAGGSTYFSNACTVPANIHGQLLINSSNNVYYQSDQDIFIYGNLACPFDAYFEALNGTIFMMGMGAAIQLSSISIINSLNINSAGTVSLYSILNLNGDLTITSGSFNAGYHSIYIKGSWDNNVGLDGFMEETSNVVFNGDDDQNLYTETFYSMTVNKPSGRIMMRPGSTINTQSYTAVRGEILVQGAVFNVADIGNTNGIWGDYRVESGEINLHQDSSSSIDLNGNWTIYEGTVRIYGGLSSCWFAASANASLNMFGGTLDVVDQGIYINDTGYSFTENITGGIIRTSRSFMVGRNDFNPSNNIIELYGSVDAYVGTADGSSLHHLVINKAAREGESLRSNTIIGSERLAVFGNLMISAGVFTAPPIIYLGGNWLNMLSPDAFIEGSSVVVFQGSDHQYCTNENFNTIRLAKSGGALRIQTANVTCNSYEWYAGAVDLIFGNFTAFDLAQDGIYGEFYVNFLSTLTLHQDSESYVDLNGTLNILGGECHIYGGSVSSWWAYSLPATVNMSAGLIYFHDQGIEIPNANINLNISGGTIRTDGSFTLNKENFQGSNWTLMFSGAIDAGLWVDQSSWLCNLEINKSASRSSSAVPMRTRDGSIQNTRSNSVYANTNLQISGNVTFTNGYIHAPALMIVQGNWTLATSTGGLFHEDGTVTFIGTQTSTITGGTGFYNCNINKSCEETAVLLNTNCSLGANSLNIIDGLVLTSSSCSVSVGNIVISEGAGLNLSGEEVTLMLLGNFTNYNTINNQTTGFFAGTSKAYIQSAFDQYFTNQVPIELYDVRITKSNGVSFRPNTSLTMHDLWIQMGGFYSTSSISHTVTGDFIIDYGVWLDHTSTLYLTGSEDQSIFMWPAASNPDNVWFNNIVINKPSGSVNVSDRPLHLRNQGNLNILHGVLDLNDQEIYATGVISIGDGAVLQMDAGSEVHIGSALEVIDGGSIQISGSSASPALVTHNQTGYPTFAIGSGASLSAEYCIFEYLSGSGVYLLPGAIVDPNHAFNYCTFRNGAENGSLLTLNDDNSYTITGASFPQNTWGSIYNVSKTVNQGEVFFNQVTGTFAGPSLENDAYNRIQWNDFRADLVVSSAAWTVSSAEIGTPATLTATIKNNGNVASTAFYLDLIYNLNLPPEFGITPDNSLLVDAIPAGDSTSVNFENIVWGVAENWQSWLIVDGSNSVLESSETNNISGPFAISWTEPQLPNLSIAFVSWTNTDPILGELIELTVSVTNDSEVDVINPVDIDLYFNPAVVPDGSVGGDQCYTFEEILAGETLQYTFTGITSNTVEIWQSYVLLDRTNAITESDEQDNLVTPASINWVNPPMPNLIVSLSPWSNSDPYIGETVEITVTVSNPSAVDVENPFAIDLYFNPGSMPDGSVDGDIWHIFSSLAAGQSVEHTFSGITTSLVEDWQAYALLDRTNGIAESDETDNSAVALPIIWHDLPPVTDLSIIHLPDTGQIKLEWNYSGPFDRFNVYASSTPEGAFDALSASTESNFIILNPGDNLRFFRVKAEKDILRVR